MYIWFYVCMYVLYAWMYFCLLFHIHPFSFYGCKFVSINSVQFSSVTAENEQCVKFERMRKQSLTNAESALTAEQVRKVLWTRKAPAGLLTLLYTYGKPRLCINIHHYAPPRSVLQHAAAVLLCYMHCAGSILRSIESI